MVCKDFIDSYNGIQGAFFEMIANSLNCSVEDIYDEYNNYVDFCNAIGYDANNKESWEIFEGVKEEKEKLNSIELSEKLISDILEIISE